MLAKHCSLARPVRSAARGNWRGIQHLVSSPLVQLRTTDACSWTIGPPVIAADRLVQVAAANSNGGVEWPWQAETLSRSVGRRMYSRPARGMAAAGEGSVPVRKNRLPEERPLTGTSERAHRPHADACSHER